MPRPAPVTRTRWPAKRAEDIIIMDVVMGSGAPIMSSRIEQSNFFGVMEETAINTTTYWVHPADIRRRLVYLVSVEEVPIKVR